MDAYRRSIYGGTLQLAQLFGLPALIQPSSTLNEKLNIQAGAALGPNEVPTVSLITIGIGNHQSVAGNNNIPLISNKAHFSDDAALYEMVPFVLRPDDNDLSAEQRAKFALRTVKTHNGGRYFAYYGLRFSKNALSIKPEKRKVVDGQTQITPFVPTADNLNPQPRDLDPNVVNTVEGEYVSASLKLKITLDAFIAEELLNAVTILYGSEDYAFISEIGLVSGVDRSIVVESNGGSSVNFTESIASQIFTHISALQPVKSQRAGFDIDLEVGAVEPLFTISG